MTDRIVIPFGPDLLVLTAQELAEARARGRELLGEGEGRTLPTSAPGPSLLDADTLAEATGIPARWWMDQARVHRVPHRRIGKRVRFDLGEVLACDAVARRGVHGSSIRNGPASS